MGKKKRRSVNFVVECCCDLVDYGKLVALRLDGQSNNQPVLLATFIKFQINLVLTHLKNKQDHVTLNWASPNLQVIISFFFSAEG